jgi:hypothetical protein
MANEQLHTLTDELNRTLEEFENAVHALNYGVPATVPMRDGEQLTYGKLGQSWRLIFETADGEPVPLLNASRGIRVQAVDYLSTLLQAIEKAYCRELVDVNTAISRVRELTKKLR